VGPRPLEEETTGAEVAAFNNRLVSCSELRSAEKPQRALERYGELMRTHILPTLGELKLQKIDSTHIDALYLSIEDKMSLSTARAVHNVLGACLAAAVRTRKLSVSPMQHVTKVPPKAEGDHGIALNEQELGKLITGFKGHSLFTIVGTAAFTGARRGEILALRWSDLDIQENPLRIERSVEQTSKYKLRFKGPKKENHKRTIKIDDDLLALLLAERDKHLRLVASVPDSAPVTLIVKLPHEALIFPDPQAMLNGDFATPRSAVSVTKMFARKASSLGFKLRLHDLRGTHETLHLDRGTPVHVVATRCGHNPATLLRNYAKRTRKADTTAAGIIGSISKGILGN
jgi:integrase